MPDGMIRRSKRGQRRAPADQSADHGPSIQIKFGKLEVVDAADPAAPARTIRRAQAVCHYDVLYRSGTLTSEQREAADCYSMLVAISGGAGKGSDKTGRTPPWMQGHPGMHALRATRELALADAAIGPGAKAIVWAVAVNNTPVASLAVTLRTNPQVARGLLVAALTRLAEHMENRSSQRVVDRH